MKPNIRSSLLIIVELLAFAFILANIAFVQFWMPTFLGLESDSWVTAVSWVNLSIFLFLAPISIFFYWRLQELLLKELKLD